MWHGLQLGPFSSDASMDMGEASYKIAIRCLDENGEEGVNEGLSGSALLS